MPSAYLDHAASTPLRPEARAALDDALELVGNPSGHHAWARAARRRLDDARDQVAAVLGVAPASITFTSGGTEADNLAVAGVLGARGGTPVCSAVEHAAVLAPVLAAGGATVAVDEAGAVRVDELATALRDRPEVSLVSVMTANNELGTVQPLDAVAEVVAAVRPGRPHGLVLHTDAVAAAAWLDLAAQCRAADLVSISGHKVGGPKGIGVLVVPPELALAPLLRGGGQERERRSGTPNVAGAIALAAALEASAADRTERVARVAAQRDRLVAALVGAGVGLRRTVPEALGAPGLANLAHLAHDSVDGEALLFLLDEAGVAASAGSSCASGALEGSHVVAALGPAAARARTTLRLSLGWSTTDAEVDHAIGAVPTAVRRLREAAA